MKNGLVTGLGAGLGTLIYDALNQGLAFLEPFRAIFVFVVTFAVVMLYQRFEKNR